MTPLEAAKFLLDDGPPEWDGDDSEWWCPYCQSRLLDLSLAHEDTNVGQFKHEEDCPVLMLPQIVAALEAAERVAEMQFAAWCPHADAISELCQALLPPATL